MGPTPFDYTEYKPFLTAWILAQPHKGHGSKAAMARAAACQTAYISQVVLGSAHLSAEQAEKLAHFFKFSEEETGYFILLVQKDRAGTESLRKHCLRQISKSTKSTLLSLLKSALWVVTTAVNSLLQYSKYSSQFFSLIKNSNSIRSNSKVRKTD